MFASVAETFVEKIDFSPDVLELSLTEVVAEINAFAGTQVLSVDELSSIDPDELKEIITKALLIPVLDLQKKVGDDDFYGFEKQLVLGSIDELWMNHIDRMAHLREEVAFEGYAQKQPLVVYKERAYDRFSELIHDIEYRVVKALVGAREILRISQKEIAESNMIVSHALPNDPTVEMSTPAVFADGVQAQPNSIQNSESGIRVIRVNEGTESPVDPRLFK